MADDATKTEEQKTETTTAEKVEQLNDATKTEADKLWESWTAQERQSVIEFARKGYAATKAEAEKKPDEKPTKIETSDDDDEAVDPKTAKIIAKMEKRFEELTGKLTEREKKEQEREIAEQGKRALEKFNAEVDAVLKDHPLTGDDEEFRALVKDAYTTHYVTHKPDDIARSLKEYMKRHEEAAGKRQQKWIDKKLADARVTRGETGSSRTPGRKEDKGPQPGDLSSGKIAQEMKRALALANS